MTEPSPIFSDPEQRIISVCLGQRQQPSAMAVIESQTWRQDTCRLRYFDVTDLRRWEAKTPFEGIIEDVRKVCSPRLNYTPLVSNRPSLVLDITAVRMTTVSLFRKAKLNARIVPLSVGVGELAVQEDGSWNVPKLDLVALMGVLTEGNRLDGKTPLLGVRSGLPLTSQLVEGLRAFKAKVNPGSADGVVWRECDEEDLTLAVALGCLAGERLMVRFNVGC